MLISEGKGKYCRNWVDQTERKRREDLVRDVVMNMGWAVAFAVVAALVGMLLLLASTMIIPRLLNKLTPNMDEHKEIARGNRAVSEYFGRIVSASIIGISIVIAAAILGGIVAGLL